MNHQRPPGPFIETLEARIAPASLTITDASVTEDDGAATAMNFSVTLSEASTAAVNVVASTMDGTATGGSDYTPINSLLIEFAPGETSKTVTVDVLGDTQREATEQFTVVLSNPNGATVDDGTGVGTILDDDPPQQLTVTLSPDGRKATFADVDGDAITIKTTKGAFAQDDFFVVASASGGQLERLDIANNSGFKGAKISAKSKALPGGIGDGFVNVGAIDAANVQVGGVKIDGDLGQLDAGSAKQLAVRTLGMAGETQAPGTIDPFRSVFGSATTPGNVAKLQVGESLRGIVQVFGNLGTAAIGLDLGIGGSNGDIGLIRAEGNIGSVTVGGSVFSSINQAEPSGIRAGGILGAVTIGFDIGGPRLGGDSAVISALGRLNPASSAAAVAIGAVSIGRDVFNFAILAGYDMELSAVNADASIGTVKVGREWTSSDIVAGTADVSGDGFGRNDALIPDGNPGIAARIASITIRNFATGTVATTTDHYGFTAEVIGKAKIKKVAVPLTSGKDNVLLDQTNNDFRLVEL